MKNNINNHAENFYDILIIGGGPAGLTAAIYAARAQSKIAIFEKFVPGGKVVKTSEIENYPGFTSILGTDLAMKMFDQTQALNIPYLAEEITNISKKENIFTVETVSKKTYYAYAVIVATGTVERKIGIPGEEELYGKGVSYCAVCDGALYKNKPIATVGGGYSALQEAEYLTKFTDQVYLIHRRQQFRADSKIVNKIINNNRIHLLLDTIAIEITANEQNRVKSVITKNVITNEIKEIPVSAVFPYIGADPISNFVKNLGVCDENGYIIVNETCQTSIPGLYGAGDVTNTSLRQIATAVSDGAKAGQFAVQYIDDIVLENN